MPLSGTPWTNDYRLHSIRFHPDGGSELIITGITQGSLNANTEVDKEVTSGHHFPQSAHIRRIAPVASFSSYNLAALWGVDGPGVAGGTATCIHSTVNPGLQMYFSKMICNGPDAGGHLEYTIGEGLIVPTSLSVDHRGSALVSYDIYAASLAGAAPFVKAVSASLPGAQDDGVRWTMDEAKFAGTKYWGKTQINIAWNPVVTQIGGDSELYDSSVVLTSMTPRVTVRGIDPDWLDNEGLNDGLTTLVGESTIPSTTLFWFKERSSTPATNNWITLGVTAIASWEQIAGGGPLSPAETTLALDCIKISGQQAISAATGQVAPV